MKFPPFLDISSPTETVRYLPEGSTPPPPTDTWAFPVGEGQYPPELWYAASWHGTYHTGLDINLAVAEFSDVERRLGLSVYAIAPGIVEYVTESWSGVGMMVIRHTHEGAPLWARYAHIIPAVMTGQSIKAGQILGSFADWRTGDHLHFDMALDQFTGEWLTPSIRWVDPVPVLKAHLDPARVDAMLKR